MTIKDLSFGLPVQIKSSGNIGIVIGSTGFGDESENSQDTAKIVKITGEHRGEVFDVLCRNLNPAPPRNEWPR